MGAGLFVLALSYFIYCYWLVFGTPAEGPLQTGVVVWNVVLFSVFALHHTVFARERIRRAVASDVGASRAIVLRVDRKPLFIAVCKLWLPVPGIVWDMNSALTVALLFLQLAGIFFIGLQRCCDRYLSLAESAAQFPTPNSQLPTTPNCQLPTNV